VRATRNLAGNIDGTERAVRVLREKLATSSRIVILARAYHALMDVLANSRDYGGRWLLNCGSASLR
jgi:hypothetical protein